MVNQALSSEKATLQRLYWWSFLARFSVGMLGWGLMYFSNIPFIADAEYYDAVASGIATDWLHGRSSTWLELNFGNHGKPVFMVTVLACFYVLTLGVRALPVLVAVYCLITAWMPVWIYRVTAQLGASVRVALLAGRLAAFLPAFIFWSAALYKEGLILLFMSILLYHALRFQRSNNGRSLFMVAVCLVVIGLLRFYLFPLLGLTFCVAILLPGRGISSQSLAVRMTLIIPLMGLIGMAGVFAAIAVDDPVPEAFGGWEEGSGDELPTDIAGAIRKMDVTRRDLALTKSGYLPDVKLESLGDVLAFMPKGTVYFLAVPLPWHIGSLTQNMAIPDTALWLLVFYPLCLIGLLRMSLRDPGGMILLLVPAIVMSCFYGVFLANIGTTYRMRTQVWILLIPFVAIGWEILQGRSPFAASEILLGRPVRRFVPQRRKPPVPIVTSAVMANLQFQSAAEEGKEGDHE